MARRKTPPHPLGVQLSSSQPSSLENDIPWIKRIGWGLASIYAVVFAGLITWYLPKELNQARESINADTARQLKPIQEQLSRLEGRLLTLTASQNPGETIREIAALAPRDFQRSLPALRKVTEQPPSEVKPDAETLQQIAEKLRQISESSPDYWPTVLRFIEFASKRMAPAGVPGPGKPTSIIAHNVGFGLSITIKSEIVLLDGGDLGPTVKFENSRIIFTENPVRMKGVQFINCVFELPKVETPNPYLKAAARSLLASNLQSVAIPSL